MSYLRTLTTRSVVAMQFATPSLQYAKSLSRFQTATSSADMAPQDSRASVDSAMVQAKEVWVEEMG